MPLTAGIRLGPYEIVAPLGAGGMGEVYRGRDTKLDREVAIKVLPERVASDAEALARFEREAKAVAALSHPNILSIFDFGSHDGTSYAVSELLEGETLRERLASGAMPLRRALECAQQVALGMAAAHDKGIIHRDLKPDNVFLTRDGRVKVLDFGLARLRPKHTEDESRSPTLSQYTDPGTVLGTVGYMSPEQVRGSPLDARSDVFSFGSMLYEMLTGRRAFHGDTAAETMTAILKDEPKELASLNETLPPALDRILRHCLEKDPVLRVQSARDLAFELELVGGLPSSKVKVLAELPEARRRWLVWAMTGALAGAVATTAALWASGHLMPAGPREPVQLSLMLPDTEVLSSWWPHVALLPDGKAVVYTAFRDGKPQLWLRRLDQAEASPISGSENGSNPFVSPDGEWVGFWDADSGTLRRTPIGGGAGRDLAKAPDLRGAGWGADGSLVFTPYSNTGLMFLPAEGGAPRPLTTLDRAKSEASHRLPQVLPGGKAALFTVEIDGKPFDEARIEAVELATGTRRVVFEGGSGARYVPGGYLLFGRHNALHAAPFDVRTLKVTGSSRIVLDGIRVEAGLGTLQADADAKTLVYLPRRPGTSDRSLVWVDREGKETIAGPPRIYRDAVPSHDGRRTVAELVSANDDLWALEDTAGPLTRLTFAGENDYPILSPDGRHILFSSDRGGGQMNIYRLPADGSGAAERLTTSPSHQLPTSVSSDGRLLLIEDWTTRDISVMALDRDTRTPPQPFANTPFGEYEGVFSPDGRWVAYTSDESGRFEIYVQAFPAAGSKRRVSIEGGESPAWSHDGRELFFRSGDTVMAATFPPGSLPSASKPRKLFEGPYLLAGRAIRVVADGRFLMIKRSEEETSSREIKVILGFDELLRRRFASQP